MDGLKNPLNDADIEIAAIQTQSEFAVVGDR